MTKKTLEIAVTSLSSAIIAEQSGADRLELCDNLEQGGITPSAGKIKMVKTAVKIPVYVLIRPRKADFHYSAEEFAVMLEDIRSARAFGADGIVSGALQADGSIDLEKTRQLIEVATPLPFTFHRAFDMCQNSNQALEQLIDLGASRILTSGQKSNAVDGKDQIAALVKVADGRIEMMAGGGIRPQNIAELLTIEGLNAFHASAKKRVGSKMQFKGSATMGSESLEAEFSWLETDGEVISALRKTLNAKKRP